MHEADVLVSRLETLFWADRTARHRRMDRAQVKDGDECQVSFARSSFGLDVRGVAQLLSMALEIDCSANVLFLTVLSVLYRILPA